MKWHLSIHKVPRVLGKKGSRRKCSSCGGLREKRIRFERERERESGSGWGLKKFQGLILGINLKKEEVT